MALTNNQPTINQQSTTNKNIKNVRSKEIYKKRVVIEPPQYILDQMNGDITETPATAEEIQRIKELQKGCI